MCKYDAKYDEILIYLNGVGESEGTEEWEMVNAAIDDNETEGEDFEAMLATTLSVAMSSVAPSDTRNKASVQDNKFVKVRYKYVQGSRKNGTSQR